MVYSAKELRIKGEQEGPKLPALTIYDISKDLIEAVNQTSWSLEEAAHYLNFFMPTQKLTNEQKQTVDRVLFWLKKSDLQKTYPKAPEDNIYKIGQGDLMRYLFSEDYPFDLRIWTLYEANNRKELNRFIEPHKKKSAYHKAIRIIETNYPTVSNKDLADFLNHIRHEIKTDSGILLLGEYSPGTISDIVKEANRQYPLSRGAQCHKDKIDLKEHKHYLIDLITKELGYLLG